MDIAAIVVAIVSLAGTILAHRRGTRADQRVAVDSAASREDARTRQALDSMRTLNERLEAELERRTEAEANCERELREVRTELDEVTRRLENAEEESRQLQEHIEALQIRLRHVEGK